jgi:Ser-tRNA(Ala) deacylase AlaX
MTKQTYLEDSYIKEADAKVTAVEGTAIELNQTIFYPTGGGQLSDQGTITCGKEKYQLVEARKENGRILHTVDLPGLKINDQVHCTLDWERRYKLMRSHTASHVLASIMHKKAGALITGNQLGLEESKIDFSLDTFDREKMNEYVNLANQEINRNLAIKTYSLQREQAMKINGIVKLAAALPPQIEILRIVEIGDIDIQADGGTHVQNTSEIGQIEITKLENKGKDRRRIYFRLA